MKKALVLLGVFFLLAGLGNNAFAGEFKICLHTNYYAPTDPIYKDVYGSGGMMFGGSLSYAFLKKFELRAEYNYFQKNGQMTFTEEDVTLTLNPIILGVRYRILDKNISPYLGAGLGTLLYKEKLPERLEQVSEQTMSFHFEGGIYLNLTQKLFIDLNFRYALASAKPSNEKIQLGGIRAGIGIGYAF